MKIVCSLTVKEKKLKLAIVWKEKFATDRAKDLYPEFTKNFKK